MCIYVFFNIFTEPSNQAHSYTLTLRDGATGAARTELLLCSEENVFYMQRDYGIEQGHQPAHVTLCHTRPQDALKAHKRCCYP